MNYVIVPKLRLVVETDVDSIEEYEKRAVDEATRDESVDIDVDDFNVSELSIKEAYTLYKCYDTMQYLSGIDKDKMLLYWLEYKGIDYEIRSDIDVSKYEREGFTLLPGPEE